MKKLIALGAVLAASPALAHGSGHMHPHGAESWLALAAGAVLIVAALVVWSRR